MKRTLYTICILIVLQACTHEQIPTGLVLKNQGNFIDTTYITASIPATQTKKVLIEEATGVHCASCPGGAEDIKNLQALFPNRVISVSVYSPFLNDIRPQSSYDFKNQDATDLVNFLGGDPSKPTAAIDRVSTPSGSPSPFFWGRPSWSTTVSSRLAIPTPINMEVIGTSSGMTDYIISSKLTFTSVVTENLSLSIYLIEDRVIDYQDSFSVEAPNYVHNHVLREIITPVSGLNFLNSLTVKEIGRVYKADLKFPLPTNIRDKSNCKIICFVHKTGSSKEVIHVEEIDL